MTFDSFLPSNVIGALLSGFRRKGGSPFNLNVLHASTNFNTYHKDREKLAMVLSSPAALKVFCLQCDLFSMGNITVKDDDDNELPDDPFLKFIENPNPFQSKAQFLWDFMFWNMIGNAYCYVDSKLVDKPGNKMYWLESHKIEWPHWMQNEADKFIFSDKTIQDRNNELIKYIYNDGTYFKFPLGRMVISNDLTNGIGNFYKGGSRLDALYKVVSNSEAALDSKNINVRYAGKFLVGSNTGTSTYGLGDEEKKDIVDKMETNGKNVFPLKTMVEIRRFVEDMKALELGTTYQEDFFLIGGMFNIPKDVLEAYIKSSTFENQEKARMAHVAYTLQPKGEQWMNSFEKHFGYTQEGKNICMSWDHLPMMQVFKQQEVETKASQVDVFISMRAEGIPLDEINAFLGTDFTIEEPEEPIQDESITTDTEDQPSEQDTTQGSDQEEEQNNQGGPDGNEE